MDAGPVLTLDTSDDPEWWRFCVDGEPFAEGRGAWFALRVRQIITKIYKRIYDEKERETQNTEAGEGGNREAV